MNQKDEWIRATILDGFGRIVAARTTALVNELQTRHQTWPTATAALGRTATIGAMMASMLKEEERLTLQIRGDGPLGGITVDADSTGRVRGFVEHPRVHLPANALGKLDVGGAVGAGMLHVMRDMGMKDFYRGSSEIQSGEIADDFTYYFAVSEQIPSVVAAGVLVDTDNSVLAAGGFIAQLMPGHVESHITQLESTVSGMKSVTQLMMEGLGPVEIIRMIDPDAALYGTQPIRFECTCSRERLRGVLKGLGQAEVASLLEQDRGAELICHYCNSVYHFNEGELRAILQEMGA